MAEIGAEQAKSGLSRGKTRRIVDSRQRSSQLDGDFSTMS